MDTKVIFIVLNSAIQKKIVCELIEKFYTNGKKVIISVATLEEGNEYDNLLWSWKQSSFIPHRFCQKIEDSIEEPILFLLSIENNPDFDVLLMTTPVAPQIMQQFHTVIDFAEKYNNSELLKSRERYKSYKEAGFKLQSLQPGEFLHGSLT